MISRTSRTVAVTACAALLAAAGCTSDGKGAPSSGLPSATGSPGLRTSAPARASGPAPAQGTVRVTRTVATGLDVPWGMALLPGGDVLVSSRDTFHIHRVGLDGSRTTDAGTVPGVASNGSQGGEGGLLGLALSPGYAADHRVYVYYSTTSDNRIAYLTYDEHAPAGRQLGTPHVVLSGIPHGLHHNGGRIAFGPDGMLYAGTGEAGHPALAQDVTSLGGKVLRMTPAGTPAPGNPFPRSVVYSYGHRNVQGLAWDPQGRLWASEFGDRKADELNLILPGHNYGWPAVQGKAGGGTYTDPVVQWGTEEDSPSGIAYAHGSIWMAALKGQRLWRIPLNGAQAAAAPEDFLVGTYGRLRSVLTTADGRLLLTTSNTDGRAAPRPGDDRILELTVS